MINATNISASIDKKLNAFCNFCESLLMFSPPEMLRISPPEGTALSGNKLLWDYDNVR